MDEKYMRRAIELAKKGVGLVNPNPLVGAVIVKDGEIIGEGYHEKYGCLHAERNALKNCVKSAKGAEMYVTLEPCCHHGKNPPCTDAVIESGIKKVYVGSYDPNPLVAGKGIQKLRENGIEVICGFLRDECDSINEIFFHFITTKTPYVILKTAVTADGKTSTETGKSKWITNSASRENVHMTRYRVSAVMTGINTVLADDPMLNCRLSHMSDKQPARIICDNSLRLPLKSNIVKTADKLKTYVATVSDDKAKIALLEALGITVIKMTGLQVDLKELMKKLGEFNIDSILIEAGPLLNSSALKAKIVNKIHIYTAPKIFGGGNGAFCSMGIDDVNDAVMLKNTAIELFDGDIFTEYEVIQCLPE